MLMSTARKINEAPVIEIGPGSTVLALDSSGAVGKGALPETIGQCSKALPFPNEAQGEWWRIANISHCGVGIICICEFWSQSAPTPIVLGVAVDAFPDPSVNANANAFKVLAGESNRISKIRLVIDGFNKTDAGWVDICIPHSDKYKNRNTRVATFGLGIKPVAIAEAPDVSAAHYVKEFDMNALTQSGGVICCTAVGPYRVAVTEKGGRHERGESADRRETAWIASSVTVHDREDVQVFQYYQHRHGHPAGTDTGHGHSRNTAIGCCGKRKHDIQSHIEREHTVSIVVRLAGNPENSCQDCGKRGQMERVVSNDVRSAIVLVTPRKEVVAA